MCVYLFYCFFFLLLDLVAVAECYNHCFVSRVRTIHISVILCIKQEPPFKMHDRLYPDVCVMIKILFPLLRYTKQHNGCILYIHVRTSTSWLYTQGRISVSSALRYLVFRNTLMNRYNFHNNRTVL